MAKPYQVLLVEDDRMIAKTLRMSLPYRGFEVTACESCRSGLEAFRAGAFDLVLLDVNLPDGSGLDVCREIRAGNAEIPILMLTAKVDEESAVKGLEGGADDYVRKPYGVKELTARMLRLLEGRKKSSRAGGKRHGSLRVEPASRLAWAGDTQLSLGKKEFEILSLLIRKAGDVATRDEILNAVGDESEIYDRTIDSHLSHLRRKLRDAGASDVQIVPVYGVGYRLEAK